MSDKDDNGWDDIDAGWDLDEKPTQEQAAADEEPAQERAAATIEPAPAPAPEPALEPEPGAYLEVEVSHGDDRHKKVTDTIPKKALEPLAERASLAAAPLSERVTGSTLAVADEPADQPADEEEDGDASEQEEEVGFEEDAVTANRLHEPEIGQDLVIREEAIVTIKRLASDEAVDAEHEGETRDRTADVMAGVDYDDETETIPRIEAAGEETEKAEDHTARSIATAELAAGERAQEPSGGAFAVPSPLSKSPALGVPDREPSSPPRESKVGLLIFVLLAVLALVSVAAVVYAAFF